MSTTETKHSQLKSNPNKVEQEYNRILKGGISIEELPTNDLLRLKELLPQMRGILPLSSDAMEEHIKSKFTQIEMALSKRSPAPEMHK